MLAFISIWGLATLTALAAAQTTPLTGSHTDIPRWCGKPYQPGHPNYDPGGQLRPPKPQSSDMLLLSVAPRHSIYVDSETTAEFIVDAGLSRIHGKPLGKVPEKDTLAFTIREDAAKKVLVSDKIAIKSTGSTFSFQLKQLKPRMEPYPITLSAKASSSGQEFVAATELYYLPAKTVGSMVKIDNLNGGMLFANTVNNFRFQPVLPFGLYTSCSGFLTSRANASKYKDLGFTAINPVCALPDNETGGLFNWMDELNIPFQYDMRGSFHNLTSVAAQVPHIKDRSSLLSWYTADEPDGWQYSFASSISAYQYLKKVDPYHPTGLVLNCQNYYFDQYTVGTDYIMEDAYPIGINATFSKWGTACNATYGDCGCDNCEGALHDVSDRLDAFRDYQTWLGRPQKPLWTVAQAFGNSEYWKREPTPAEAWAMNLLGFNHGAKGVMSWLFPSSDALNHAHGAMAKVFTTAPVEDFLLGGNPTLVKLGKKSQLDVAYWTVNDQVMVSLVNQDYSDSTATVSIPLPLGVSNVVAQPWGNVKWQVQRGKLSVKDVPKLATSVVLLDTGKKTEAQEPL